MTPEQRLLATTLDKALTDADVPSIIRAWRTGNQEPGLALWQNLAITTVLDDGGSWSDLVVVFEQLGRHAVPGPWVETIAVAPQLPRVPGPIITVAYDLALDADVANQILIVKNEEVAIGHISGPPKQSIDRTRHLFSVTADETLGAATPTAWNAGALACAAQLWGLGSRALDMAVEHAKLRTQFGRPIGSFQAVQHRLADAHIALAMARPLLHAAARSQTPQDISAAKAMCGNAADQAARTALQTHGAIGYTDEHDLGHYVTKIRALVHAWGTTSTHRARVLAALCD